MLADFLDRLSPRIVIQRLFASAPDDILIAPVWNRTRSEFLLDLDAFMERAGSCQGKACAAEGS
jgi:radical SAM superfamily enzyme